MDGQAGVSVQVLRQTAEILLRHLEEVEGPEVRLEKDYFWSVPEEQLYDVYSEPTSFTVGQLSECMSNLEALTEDPERVITYGLVWLGDVIRAVGQAVVR
jgi:hypothetical protein